MGSGLCRFNFSDKFLYFNSVFEFQFELYLNFRLNCICSSSYSALSDQLSADSVGLARPPLFIKLCVLSIWICDQTFWTAFSKLLLMLCDQLRAETVYTWQWCSQLFWTAALRLARPSCSYSCSYSSHTPTPYPYPPLRGLWQGFVGLTVALGVSLDLCNLATGVCLFCYSKMEAKGRLWLEEIWLCKCLS